MPYTYWYAIIPSPPSGRPGAEWASGLRGSALRLVVAGEVAAVVSDWREAAVKCSMAEVDTDLAWQHEHIIESIMADCAVLPMRFGTVLTSDERVRAALAEREAEFGANLSRVAGCIEMGLRVLWQPPAEAACVWAGGITRAAAHVPLAHVTPPSQVHHRQIQPSEPATAGAIQGIGAQYLLRRAAEEQARQAVCSQAQALAGELTRDLAALAVDLRISVLPTERMLLSAAYLIPRIHTGSFMTAVEQLRAQHPQLAFMWSGPWPPYHFVSA